MIPSLADSTDWLVCKPRASGDDPESGSLGGGDGP